MTVGWSEVDGVPRVLEVPVTADDLADGACGDPFHCAVALALRRMGYVRPIVLDDGWVGMEKDGRGMRYAPSYGAHTFIRDFDAGRPLEPVTLTFALRWLQGVGDLL